MAAMTITTGRVTSAVADPGTHTITLFTNGRQIGIITCRHHSGYMASMTVEEDFAGHISDLRLRGVHVEILVPLTAAMAALSLAPRS